MPLIFVLKQADLELLWLNYYLGLGHVRGGAWLAEHFFKCLLEGFVLCGGLLFLGWRSKLDLWLRLLLEEGWWYDLLFRWRSETGICSCRLCLVKEGGLEFVYRGYGWLLLRCKYVLGKVW